MAESVGIFIEFDIDENSLKKLLNKKLTTVDFDDKVGYYFSKLLYQYSLSASNGFFILNFDEKFKKCYIGWLQNYYEEKTFNNFKEVLQLIASYKKSSTINYAIIATIFPEILEAFKLAKNQVKKVKTNALPVTILKQLINRFWSFSDGHDFPDAQMALRKRNFYFKNFKNYYRRYLDFIEQQLKPQKIEKATEQSPYCLLDNKYYTFNKKVYELVYQKREKVYVEIPKADPYTFRQVAAIEGVYADKNFVYIKDSKGYSILEGADGSSFNYVKEKWDILYFKDKETVWVKHYSEQFRKVKNSDSKSFEYLGFCFGKDKNHIFYLDKVIPINVNKFTLNKNGFIYDNENIFHYQHSLPLDASTFKVLSYESEVNPFIGTFLLEDKNGKYEYNREWKNRQIKPIT